MSSSICPFARSISRACRSFSTVRVNSRMCTSSYWLVTIFSPMLIPPIFERPARVVPSSADKQEILLPSQFSKTEQVEDLQRKEPRDTRVDLQLLRTFRMGAHTRK